MEQFFADEDKQHDSLFSTYTALFVENKPADRALRPRAWTRWISSQRAQNLVQIVVRLVDGTMSQNAPQLAKIASQIEKVAFQLAKIATTFEYDDKAAHVHPGQI